MKKVVILFAAFAAVVALNCNKLGGNVCKKYGEKMEGCLKEVCKGKDSCQICQDMSKQSATKMDVPCEGDFKAKAEAGLNNFKTCDDDMGIQGIKKIMPNMKGCE